MQICYNNSMSIFDYKCANCGHIIEVVHHCDDKPSLVCTKCGSEQLNKTYENYRTTVIFEGTGWTPYFYKTAADFKSKKMH